VPSALLRNIRKWTSRSRASESANFYRSSSPSCCTFFPECCVQDLVTAYENFDVEAFTQAVVDFDSISKLDQWKTTILLRIKNSIKSEESGDLR
jgi:hypothetical protein